jgi:zinc transport system ATP-binding protein
MTTALKVKDVSATYAGYSHPAIENVSFELEQGVIASVIGPNGSGKTTLIKAILGLIRYKGEIEVFGLPVEKAYQRIGYVPQKFSFDPTFPITVNEFIALTLYELDKYASGKAVRQALNFVEAAYLGKRKLSELSGGQLQRVLLARALAKEPELLLLDEPEAGVDVGGEQTFYDLLQKLVSEKQITALISSHELDVVYTYAQQVICLNRKMLCVGEPREVLDKKMFEQLYGRDLKFYGHTHSHH